MCHYGNSWCHDRSDTTHECPPKPRAANVGRVNVHNHGTEEGRGLSCPEHLIGVCQIEAYEARIAILQADRNVTRQDLREARKEIDAMRAERDGLRAKLAAIREVAA